MSAVVAAAAALVLASPASALTVGAYYYAWYEPGRWQQGYLRDGLAQPPALGEYSSADPSAVATHFRWARRYGVDLFLVSWWGPGGYDDAVLRERLLPSPARGRTRIAVLYESTARLPRAGDRIWFDEAARRTMVSDFDHLARTVFRHPGYYRVGGRPVVVLYVSRIYRGAFAEAVRAVRDHVRRVYGLELYLIGDEIDWDLGPARSRIKLYDAITGYTLYSRTQAGRAGPFLRLADARLRAFRRAARLERVAFVPGVLPGFNDRGYRPEQGHYVLPRDAGFFARYLRLAGRYVDRRLGLLTVTSWNEWHEDTQIEPTAPAASSAADGHTYRSYGFELLETLARFKAAFERAARR